MYLLGLGPVKCMAIGGLIFLLSCVGSLFPVKEEIVVKNTYFLLKFYFTTFLLHDRNRMEHTFHFR